MRRSEAIHMCFLAVFALIIQTEFCLSDCFASTAKKPTWTHAVPDRNQIHI